MKATSVVVSVFSIIVVSFVPAWAACDGDSPLSVLDCYSSAYADRDIDALGALYAPDYIWITVAPPGADVWQRDMAMDSAGNMFRDPDLKSVTLTLAGDPKLVENEKTGTWRIEGIDMTIATVLGESEEPYSVSTCATLYVRNNGDGYEIFREVTIGDGGCDTWLQADSEE